MRTSRAILKRTVMMGLAVGFGSLVAGAATAAQDRAGTAQREAGDARGASAALGAAVTRSRPDAQRVYRSVGPDGRVTFGDQPEPGARAIEIRSFASSSDDEAIATARAQREYWREQSEAFARRRMEREEAEQRAERERYESAPSALFAIPFHQPPPRPVPLPQFPVHYGSGPGLASGTPSGFISSGFAGSAR